MKFLILNNLHVIFLMIVWSALLVMTQANTFYFVVLFVGLGIGLVARYDRMKIKGGLAEE